MQMIDVTTYPKILISFCRINFTFERYVKLFSSRMMVNERAWKIILLSEKRQEEIFLTNCSMYFERTVSLRMINKTRQKLSAD